MLCGGNSERMGFDKWRLPIGSVTMLDHIVEQLQKVCSPIVSSVSTESSTGSARLEESDNVFEVTDDVANAGPMEGIRASLEFLETRCRFAFVTACDIPFVNRDVIEHLRNNIGDAEAVIPVRAGRRFGMTSLIRTTAHTRISRLISNRQLKVSYLADELNCVEIQAEQLQSVDENLLCLTNINTPDQYTSYLKSRGIECDPETHKLLFDRKGRSS